MNLSTQTQKLSQEFIANLSSEDQAKVQEGLTVILESDAGASAFKPGDHASDFTLPNANGSTTRLKDLLQRGPVVLSFYRGGWCPYCNLEFKALNDILPKIHKLGAQLIGISPQLPDNSLSTVEKQQLKFEVLSDVGNVVAQQYGIVMNVPEIMRPLYLKWGLDVPVANGDDTWDLPIPATFIINTDSKIAFSYVNKNYTERLEPSIIVSELEALSVTA